MAQYDHIFRQPGISSTIFTPEEAIVAIAVVTIAADSSLEMVDSYSIIDTLWRFEVFEEYSDEELSKIVDKALAIARKEGVAVLFNTVIRYLSDEIILNAFAVSVSMLVDEETLAVPTSKLPLLDEIQKVLELDKVEAKQIVDQVAFPQYEYIFHKPGISSTIFTQEEAVVAIATISIAADNSLGMIDSYSIIDTLWKFEVFEEYSDQELSNMIDRVLAIAQTEGIAVLFNTAIRYLSDEIILDAFAVGVAMLVDEETLAISPRRLTFIRKLQTIFELDKVEAEEIIDEVLSILEEAEEFSFADEYETFPLENLSNPYYESPEGHFRVYVPVSADRGGQVQTREGVAEFSDESGTLLRIDYYRLSNNQQQDLNAVGKERYLHSILIEKYVPLGIIANLPNSQIEYSEYIHDRVSGSYYTLVNMPQVVSKFDHGQNGNGARRNAYRGILAFIQYDFLYIVSKQRNVVTKFRDDTLRQETEDIKLDLMKFVESIEFKDS